MNYRTVFQNCSIYEMDPPIPKPSQKMGTRARHAYDSRKRSTPNPGSKFMYEMHRLSSYKSLPKWAKGHATTLAKAGFYYSGLGKTDEVTCYVCELRVDDWSVGDNPLQKHCQLSPNCSFIIGMSENVDWYSGDATKTNLKPSAKTEQTLDAVDENDGAFENQITSVREFQMQTGEHAKVGITSSAVCQSELSQINSGHFIRQQNTVTSYELRTLEGRIKTFEAWLITSPLRPRELSEAGLFYTGQDDVVKCFKCNITIGNWRQGQSAMNEHAKVNPNCLYLLQHPTFMHNQTTLTNANHRQAPISPTKSSLIKDTASLLDTIPGLSEDDNPIVKDRARYPEYSIESKRLQSYEKWPITKQQKPSELAEAGFIYAGFNDNVKCFFCAGGLRNWDPPDVPWEEHARWFPKCGFLKQCKGLDYVKSFAHQRKPKMKDDTGTLPKDAQSFMDTPCVQSVQDMGYSDKLIKKALSKLLAKAPTIDKNFPKSDELMDAVFDIEESTSCVDDDRDDSNHESDELIKPEEDAANTNNLIFQEYQKLKSETLCIICGKKDRILLFIPCSHLLTCETCGQNATNCHKCGKPIKAAVKTYKC